MRPLDHAPSKKSYKIRVFCDNPPPFSSPHTGSGRREHMWTMGYRACGVVEGDLEFWGKWGMGEVPSSGERWGIGHESAQSPPPLF